MSWSRSRAPARSGREAIATVVLQESETYTAAATRRPWPSWPGWPTCCPAAGKDLPGPAPDEPRATCCRPRRRSGWPTPVLRGGRACSGRRPSASSPAGDGPLPRGRRAPKIREGAATAPAEGLDVERLPHGKRGSVDRGDGAAAPAEVDHVLVDGGGGDAAAPAKESAPARPAFGRGLLPAAGAASRRTRTRSPWWTGLRGCAGRIRHGLYHRRLGAHPCAWQIACRTRPDRAAPRPPGGRREHAVTGKVNRAPGSGIVALVNESPPRATDAEIGTRNRAGDRQR